jgi:4-hydroxy-tetrahydrodipicolinate synthase
MLSYKTVLLQHVNGINLFWRSVLQRRIFPSNAVRRKLSSTDTSTVLVNPSLSHDNVVVAKQQHLQPLRGVYPVMVTPFLPDQRESIDYDSFRKCLSFLKQQVGCQGVTILGVLGEANRLTDFEKQQLIETAVDTNRQCQTVSSNATSFSVCVGVSHAGTAATVDLCQMAAELGADAVMVSPSKDSAGSPQPSDNAIFDLFVSIAEACPTMTIVLQDLPSVTAVHMPMELIGRMVTEIAQVTTIKLESTPSMSRIADFHARSSTMNRNSYSILTGLGGMYAGFDLGLGNGLQEGNVVLHKPIDGFMTGFAFPEVLLAMMKLTNERHYEKARRLFQTFLPLMVLEQIPGEGLALRKEIYQQRGLILSSHVRKPGRNLSKELQNSMQEQLDWMFVRNDIDIKKPIIYDQILSTI